MTYGIEIKNKSDQTIIGEVQNLIERVSFGTKKVRVYKAGGSGSDYGTEYNGGYNSRINYPAGVNRENALIFARPEISDAFGAKEETLALSCWPMALMMEEDHFYFLAPDANIDYYDSKRGDVTLPISNSLTMYVSNRYDNFFTEQNPPDVPTSVCRVYYEIWRVDAPPSVEEADYGVKIQRPFMAGFDEIFNTNRRFFQADIINVEDYNTSTPFVADVDGFWSVNDDILPVLQSDLPSVNLRAANEYLTLMNVTAGLSAVTRGAYGGITDTVEVPADPYTAYYKRFIEWHFGGKGNAGHPFVRLVSRLAYNKETEDSSFYEDIRYNNDMGEKPAIVIGKTS